MHLILIVIAVILYAIPVFFALVTTLSIKMRIKGSTNEPTGKQLLIYTLLGAALNVGIINLFSIYEWPALGVAILIGVIIGIIMPESDEKSKP